MLKTLVTVMEESFVMSKPKKLRVAEEEEDAEEGGGGEGACMRVRVCVWRAHCEAHRCCNCGGGGAGEARGVRHGYQLPEPLRGIIRHMPAAGMTWVPPRVARHEHHTHHHGER